MVIGYAMHAAVGIPAFSFGAGLNLFDNEIVGYFINRLGAYRVDRRKKNPIYLECLTSMAAYSIQKGINNLFFPGGTRSRNGGMEDRLKLGLLGSSIEAQRNMVIDGQKMHSRVIERLRSLYGLYFPKNQTYLFPLESRWIYWVI